MPPLSDSQEKILSLLPIFPSLASLLASCVLVYVTFKRRRRAPFHRFLLGMSLFDVLQSLSFPLQPFLLPESGGRVWARGNVASCSAMGFILQMGIGTYLYNFMLNMNFLLTVYFEMDVRNFPKYAEPLAHLIVFIYAIGTSLSGVILGVFKESELGTTCWVAGYWPENCNDVDGPPCIALWIGVVYASIPSIIVALFLLISNIMIYTRVSKVNRSASFLNGVASIKTPASRNKDVAIQALLYVTACYTVGFWISLVRYIEATELYSKENESGIFWLLIMAQITYPMHGFGTFLAYVRPRYVQCRRRNPEQTKMWCLHQSLFVDAVETRRSRRFTTRPRQPVESNPVDRTPATEIPPDEFENGKNREQQSSVSWTCNYAAATKLDDEFE